MDLADEIPLILLGLKKGLEVEIAKSFMWFRPGLGFYLLIFSSPAFWLLMAALKRAKFASEAPWTAYIMAIEVHILLFQFLTSLLGAKCKTILKVRPVGLIKINTKA